MDKTNADYEKIFFDLNIKSLDGKNIELSEFKNKAVLIVNVASNCGFTKQYSDLQELWETYKEDGLIVLGIPSINLVAKNLVQMMKLKNFVK